MGFTKALYYPTIDINNEDWLKNAVLFWDEINTIVPSSIDQPYNNDFTKSLFYEGILQPIEVNPDFALIDELTADTLNYLNSNEALQVLNQSTSTTIHRDKFPYDVQLFFDIHPEKLSHEIRYRLRDNLTEEGWFRVDGNFAAFYMTLLANRICEKTSIALLTDNTITSNLSDIVRLDNRISIGPTINNYRNQERKNPIHLAQGLLTNMIIDGVKISSPTPLSDILKFKKNHKDELGLFRSNVAKLTKDLDDNLSFDEMRQKVHDLYNDEFLPAYNSFKQALNSSGIKWVSENIMKISVFSTGATGGPMALGLALPQALIAGAGISIVSSVISYNVDKKDKLRNNPYSYLLAVNNRV